MSKLSQFFDALVKPPGAPATWDALSPQTQQLLELVYHAVRDPSTPARGKLPWRQGFKNLLTVYDANHQQVASAMTPALAAQIIKAVNASARPHCPQCNALTNQDQRFCHGCGYELAAPNLTIPAPALEAEEFKSE